MKRQYIFYVLAILIVAVVAGCTDKTADNPTRPVYDENGYVWYPQPYHYEAVMMTTNGDGGSKGLAVYTPFGYNPNSGGSRPYPVLYLLTPFRQDELYYFKRGLDKVADRLIEEGKIEPMIIVCVDGQSQLGASFYTNSLAQGLFFTGLVKDTIFIDDFVGVPVQFTGYSLITAIDSRYPTLDDRENRAIAGVGVGGYGAMKLAIETDLFSAATAVNAPLDFDGTGSGGFRSLMQNYVIPGMTWPVDTSLGDEVTSLMVSAAAAFAPHPTALNGALTHYELDQYNLRVFVPSVSSYLTTDSSTLLTAHNAHMPFNSSGTWNNFIWGQWMAHNLDSLYVNDAYGTASGFTAMPKLLIYSDDAKFNYDEQMNSFMQFMNGNAITYTAEKFQGSGRLDGSASNYIYDLLEDILIFHSEHFDVPDGI
ncbi:MAG: alpha/beta hydrolase-fold protein [Candidatus Zixiibacteriota bacterium]